MLLYRLLMSLFSAVALVGAVRRGGAGLLRARLGMTPAAQGPHLWWHGASNGELASARPILERVIAARPDLAVLVTCNSDTGQTMVDGWALPRVTTRPAPLDLGWVTRRVMRRWDVRAHVTLESEIWPNRVLSCPGPVIVLGARMTDTTARAWARMPRLARRVIQRLSLVIAQDDGSLDRLRRLGLPQAACGPVADLKALYDPGSVRPDDMLRAAFARNDTWLAASTHPGEEETVLAAHARARQSEPGLRLILAPRHAARGDAVAALVAQSGLSCARRSTGAPPRDAAVYLADTMGEMPLWYALAGRVFIGGTLTDRGGHTPYEPAAFGAALIHGPDVANFAAPFARLERANAALRVTDGESLAAALNKLGDADEQARMGLAARQALHTDTDATALAALVQQALRDVTLS